MDAAKEQTQQVVELVRDVLGASVLGVYLHGSSVFGGLHAMSDLDVLAVIGRATTSAERRELIERLLPISGRGDGTRRARPIELTIVVQGDVRPWCYPPRLEFEYGDWWRGEFAHGNLAPWSSPNPDLALLLEMVLQANRPLFGPPPADVLDPVPPGDFRRAMIDGIPALLSYLDGDEANVVLTFVRIWTTLATGVIRSKDAAADWALPLLPPEHRPVLEHARAIYLGDVPGEWTDLLPGVRPFVDHAIGEIGKLERANAPTS
jgi:streptomycin 3"-adenylyltransferase